MGDIDKTKKIEDADLDYLINKAADVIGTEKEYRNIVCIDVALTHAESLRRENSTSIR